MGGIARTVARLRGIPYVVSLHGNYLTLPIEQSDKMQEPFKGKLEWGKFFGFLLGSRKTISDADAVICVDSEEYTQLKALYPHKNINYLPNGVNIDFFRNGDPNQFRHEYGITEHEKYILCVSRIDYQKNQKTLIKAFAEFKKNSPNHKLVLIGPVTVDQYFEEIKELISKLKLDQSVVIIPGLRPDDPLLASAYKGADMFVLPSCHEPFGMVILEAWAAGIPVIAADLPGIKAFSTDKSDILHFDHNSFTDLLEKMNTLNRSGALRYSLTFKAAKTVIDYSWSSITHKLSTIYHDLIKR